MLLTDAADDSVGDEDESVDLAVAELDTTTLEQIRDALQRIDDRTFGRCVVTASQSNLSGSRPFRGRRIA